MLAGSWLLWAGGHWGLEERRWWFAVLALSSVLHMSVLRPVGAEAWSDHMLRATWVPTVTRGSLGGGYPGYPSLLAQPLLVLLRCL